MVGGNEADGEGAKLLEQREGRSSDKKVGGKVTPTKKGRKRTRGSKVRESKPVLTRRPTAHAQGIGEIVSSKRGGTVHQLPKGRRGDNPTFEEAGHNLGYVSCGLGDNWGTSAFYENV